MDKEDLIAALPKAELHVHIEGTLEPAMMLELAERNGLRLPYASLEEIEAAYDFGCLQDFLDLYYAGMSVLITADDFHDLAWAYFRRARADNVRRVEYFFDPQGHTGRGIDLATVMEGLLSASARAERELGMSVAPILCFLRHLPEADAFETLEAAEPWREQILGIGLDSSELGYPPENFARVFAEARRRGYLLVAHCGEEGPAEYVRDGIDLLGIDRIDHGNRALEDPALVERIARTGLALTVCPLSNLRLCGVTDMRDHPLRRMLQAGLKATVNSDDPAYFGGYMNDNFRAVRDALGLDDGEIVTLARNSIEASFMDDGEKAALLSEFDAAREDRFRSRPPAAD
jgi:adenosine deaminase